MLLHLSDGRDCSNSFHLGPQGKNGSSSDCGCSRHRFGRLSCSERGEQVIPFLKVFKCSSSLSVLSFRFLSAKRITFQAERSPSLSPGKCNYTSCLSKTIKVCVRSSVRMSTRSYLILRQVSRGEMSLAGRARRWSSARFRRCVRRWPNDPFPRREPTEIKHGL